MRPANPHACAILLVLVAGSVTACTSGDPESPTVDGLSVAQDDRSTPGEGDAALLTGIVHDSAGCLTVRDPVSGSIYTPIFPASMTSPGALSIAGGDEISLRGGAQSQAPTGATIPESCTRTGPFWVVVEDE